MMPTLDWEMAEIIYCSYHGRPTVYLKHGGGYAWWFYGGAWKAAPGPEIFVSAPVLSSAAFAKRFGRLPPLPNEARAVGSWSSRLRVSF
jgi:hypothetical protein